MHNDIKKYQCEKCYHFWKYRTDRDNHQKDCDTEEKPFPCRHCGRSFGNAQALGNHKKTHN